MSTNKLVLIFLVLIPITFSSTIYRRRRSDDQNDAINNHMDSFGADVEPYAEEEATNSSDVQTRAERRKGLNNPASPPNTDPVQSAVTSDQEKKKVTITTTADSSDGNKSPDNLDVMPNPKKGSSHESDPDTSSFGKGASGKQNKLSQHDDEDFLPEMGLLNLGPSDASSPNRDAPLKQPLNIWGTKNVIILLSKLQLNCDKLLA